MQGVYVHIPFCANKCSYCDFHSVVADKDIVGNYVRVLQQEIRYYRDQIATTDKFSSLFIGGGTPTILSASQLYTLVTQLVTDLSIDLDGELTIEANPATLTIPKLTALRDAGINRISLGVQAFQDDILRRIGRVHQVADVWTSLNQLHQAGFSNYSLDLMFGLPGQTLTDWEYSLQQAASSGAPHLSCYSLTVEEGTPFAIQQRDGALNLPDEDEDLSMFQWAREYLPTQGLAQYEISNFARPGMESKHNTMYWLNRPYLALGSGAHGHWQGVRYANTKDISAYIVGVEVGKPVFSSQEKISAEQAMDETMMVGMRLLQGVNEKKFQQRFTVSYFDVYQKEIEELVAKGLVEFTAGNLRLTEIGIDLGNIVFSAFIR